MAIITLTTDWGDTDYYVAAAKARILSQNPEVTLVDITHKIRPFDTTRAAYILRHAYPNFPKGTIHLLGINTEETEEISHIVTLYDGHYFIGADDGVFSLIFQKEPEDAVYLETEHEGDVYTFSTRDRFANAALMLAKGASLKDLGKTKASLVQKISFEPTSNQQGIRGMVIHIDSYENLITNISKQLFDEVVGNKPFIIRIKGYEWERISMGYSDVAEGEPVCFFGSNHLLQIALNRANAASLLGVRYSEAVNIILEPISDEPRPDLKLL